MPLLLPGRHALASRVSVRVNQGHQARRMRPLPALFELRSQASVDQIHEHLQQASLVRAFTCHCNDLSPVSQGALDIKQAWSREREFLHPFQPPRADEMQQEQEVPKRRHSMQISRQPAEHPESSQNLSRSLQEAALSTFFLFRTPRSTGRHRPVAAIWSACCTFWGIFKEAAMS